jgi:hypothetical protein
MQGEIMTNPADIAAELEKLGVPAPSRREASIARRAHQGGPHIARDSKETSRMKPFARGIAWTLSFIVLLFVGYVLFVFMRDHPHPTFSDIVLWVIVTVTCSFWAVGLIRWLGEETRK